MITPGYLLAAMLLASGLMLLGVFIGAALVYFAVHGLPAPQAVWGSLRKHAPVVGDLTPLQASAFCAPPSMEAVDPPPADCWPRDIGPRGVVADHVVLEAWEEAKRMVAEGTLSREWLDA